MINNINLTGRLTQNIELKYTKEGKALAHFTLAFNHYYNTGKEPEVSYFNCTVWGKSAEYLQTNTKKGDLIMVSGVLKQERYEKEGQQKESVKIIITSYVLATKSKDGGF